ncbi:MAG TPA: hypothetical protein VHF69_04085 [Candidatus Synoicihabitans sp.]|nr:hypothetical protein [Candidatus Synoicihabitans sp.]
MSRHGPKIIEEMLEHQRRAEHLEFQRERGCTSKKRYDKRGAMSVINQAQKRRGRKGNAERLICYPCEFCAGWHLGSRRE